MLGINNIQKNLMIFNNKKIDLVFDFKTIENLYYNLQTWEYKIRNPLTFIKNFSEEKVKDRKENYLILSSFVNGRLSEDEVAEIIENNESDELFINLIAIIVNELKVDDIFFQEEEESNAEEENVIDDEKNFLYFWDNSYYIARIVLRMTDEEFYNTTPKTLYTLQKIDRKYKKEIILERDIELQKAEIKASNGEYGSIKKKEKVIMCKSLKDLL